LTDWRRNCVVVVGAAQGYPGPYRKGIPLHLPPDDLGLAWTIHAGTRRENDTVMASGGRVFGAVGEGPTLAEARRRAYAHIGAVQAEGIFFRRDIAAQQEEERA
jgi:phosphoribosylamine--glycine ligase